MRRVILESPYAGKTPDEVEANVNYARACVRDCLLRGDAPIASHLLYTQPGVLRDKVQEERALGMKAGFTWTQVAEAIVVYTGRGITPGMKSGITRAEGMGIPVEYRAMRWVLPVHDVGGIASNDTDADLSPDLLSALLLTVGVTLSARELVTVCPNENDVLAAARWARAAHAHNQGQDVEIPTAPAWLEPYLCPKSSPETA